MIQKTGRTAVFPLTKFIPQQYFSIFYIFDDLKIPSLTKKCYTKFCFFVYAQFLTEQTIIVKLTDSE